MSVVWNKLISYVMNCYVPRRFERIRPDFLEAVRIDYLFLPF